MIKTDPTAPATQQRWEQVAKNLAPRGVDLSAMFGMPALKFGGKAFGGLFGDSLVLKLEGDAHTNALNLKGAGLFDPSGMGRPMKAWVVIPSTHHATWPQLTLAALANLASTPTAKPKAKPKSKKATKR